MSKYNYIQNSFTSGELSEKLLGRTDIADYSNGAELIKNAIVFGGGGTRRRPGTVFMSDDSDLSTINQLIPFEGEFGGSNALHLIGLGSDLTAWDTNGVKGSVTQHDTLPDRPKYHYAQSGDLLFIVSANGDMPPYVIKRTGITTFEGASILNITDDQQPSTINLSLRHPLQPENVAPLSLTVTGGPSYTITAAPIAPSAMSATIFTADDVGRLIRIEDGATTRYFRITVVTAPPTASVTAVGVFADAAVAATDAWSLSSWSDSQGPFSVSIHEQRLIFGGNPIEKDTVHFSATGNLFHFAQSRFQQALSPRTLLSYTGNAVDSDPFEVIISSRFINEIKWLNAGRQLALGTTSGEYIVAGGEANPLARNTAVVRQQSSAGGYDTQSILVDQSVLFIGRTANLMDLSFRFEADQYKADDLTLLNDRITRLNFDAGLGYYEATVEELSYSPSRHTLWMKNNTGKGFIGLTLNKDLKVIAFHRHEIPATSQDDSVIETMVSAANRRDTGDTLYMVVRRELSSGTEYTLEAMPMDYELDALEDSLSGLSSKDDVTTFLDGQAPGVFVSGTTYSGFSHLAGETVGVLVDGKVHPDVTVNGSGEITLNFTGSLVQAGLRYETKIKTFPLEAGQDFGSAQGMRKRIDRAHIRFYKSATCEFSTDDTNYEDIIFKPGNHPMGDPLPLFTGDKKVDIRNTPEDDPRIYLKTDAPLPMAVTALILRGVSYD